ncbi:MAG: ribulose-phosphate 3-epimerase [bacterium]|nr:ribulose-phosphate 3-epimerase [bacterium]
MTEIIPSILVKTKEELLEKISAVEQLVERVHLDIADGIFVPNMTIAGFSEIETIETTLKFRVHLMVSKPENHILRWLNTLADSFTFHIESTNQPIVVIEKLREAEKEIGLALNPRTPLSAIEPFINEIDFVHFMTVEPGFYGGEFMEEVLDKMSDFHYFYPDKPIVADGGVTPENAPKLVQAGANTLIVGSYIFKNGNPAKALEELRKSISE